LQSCWWKEIQSLDAEVDEESKLFCTDVCVDCVEFEDNFLKVKKNAYLQAADDICHQEK
jgi:hypothetical protein